MATTTPVVGHLHTLKQSSFKCVQVDELPWRSTPTAGVKMKVLLKNPDTDMLTALFRCEPGSVLPLDQHVTVEQAFVLEGSLVDKHGEVSPGNSAWHPADNRHIARSPNGALVLVFCFESQPTPLSAPVQIAR